MTNSIVNIESKHNNSFGTGFVIDRDEAGVYILTCRHVLDDVGIPTIEEREAKVVAEGDFIDLAVIYLPQCRLEPLPLEINLCNNSMVEVVGFSHFNQLINQKNISKLNSMRMR